MESGHDSEQGSDEGRGLQERDMVAPDNSRAPWERIDASKGPGITGRKEDWLANNFKLMSFMKDHLLDKTMKGEDTHKNSDDEHEQAIYRRRDGIVFTTLTRQISEATIEGKTLSSRRSCRRVGWYIGRWRRAVASTLLIGHLMVCPSGLWPWPVRRSLLRWLLPRRLLRRLPWRPRPGVLALIRMMSGRLAFASPMI